MSDTLFVYTFARDNIEQGVFSDFLDHFHSDRLPTGPRLKVMMGSLLVVVDGYDDDPRELYMIPAVRCFFADRRSTWPYWLYFFTLETDVLLTLYLLMCDRACMNKAEIHARLAQVVRYFRLPVDPENL